MPGSGLSGRLALEWIAPAAFGLWVFVAAWLTSASPQPTLPALAWCTLATAVLLLGTLRALGRRLSMPRDVGLLLFALGASMVASNFLLSTPSWSLPRLGLYISLSLVGVAFYLMYRDAVRIPLQGYCIAIAVLHVPFFIEVMAWAARSGPDFFTRSMAVAHFSHVRHFGYLGFLAAMAATALVTLPGRFDLASLLLAGCALFGIVATGSRGALLSWLAFVLLLVCFSPARWRVLAFSLAALTGSASLVWYLHSSGLLESPNIFVRVQQLVAVPGTELGSGRVQIWRDSLGVIARHPLFGMGTEAYRITGCCDRRVAQPHNFVLQLLMQFGLVGSALLAALCWRALRALGGLRRVAALTLASPENLALAAMLAAFLAFSCIDGLLYREVPLIHFAVLCGLFAAGLHRARESSGRMP